MIEYKYQIIEDYDLCTLRSKVNYSISQGYKPQGGVVCTGGWEKTFAQAMVKECEEALDYHG
jgi:hypothetical protein